MVDLKSETLELLLRTRWDLLDDMNPASPIYACVHIHICVLYYTTIPPRGWVCKVMQDLHHHQSLCGLCIASMRLLALERSVGAVRQRLEKEARRANYPPP